jgi:hypothetical protein
VSLSQSNEIEDSSLVECDIILGDRFSTFGRNVRIRSPLSAASYVTRLGSLKPGILQSLL